MEGDAEVQVLSDPRKEKIEGLNKIGAYTIPIIAIVSWAVGMVYCGYAGGGWSSVEYGDFVTHPAMMLTGFLLVGSLCVICFNLCRDLGIPEQTAKWIHITLNTVVVVFVWLGWDIIFELHSAAGAHYKGSHSRIGIFALCLWSVYYVAGIYVFVCAPQSKAPVLLEVHRVMGLLVIILALYTAALGLMWNEYTFDSERDEYGRATSGVVLGGLLVVSFFIVITFYARTLVDPTK